METSNYEKINWQVLLKWRGSILKDQRRLEREKQKALDAANPVEKVEVVVDPSTKEEELMLELAELKAKSEKRGVKEQKRLRQRKLLLRRKLAEMKMNAAGEPLEDGDADELFRLNTIQGSDGLKSMETYDDDEEDDDEGGEDEDDMTR